MPFPPIKEFMTRRVITVKPHTPLVEVERLITGNKLNGVPVVDDASRLLGIVTEYNLISTRSFIHLPTLQAVLKDLPVLRKDRAEFREAIHEVAAMAAQDVMDATPLTLPETAAFEDAARAFNEHHRVNPIVIIDKENRVVGVVSRCDVLRVFAESHTK